MNKSEELIACLEGEIAKRDEGLAACRVAVENCELFRARIAELEAENENLAAAVRVSQQTAVAVSKELRAELAAIKAQGVVIDADDLAQFIREIDGNHKMGAGVLAEHIAARLNAAPIQRVSVPDERAAFEVKFPPEDGVEWSEADQRYEAFTAFDRSRQHAVDWQNSMLEVWQARAMIDAPAAPAADAGLVDALEKLARPGNGDKHGNSDGNLIAQAALAAHRAKGVV